MVYKGLGSPQDCGQGLPGAACCLCAETSGAACTPGHPGPLPGHLGLPACPDEWVLLLPASPDAWVLPWMPAFIAVDLDYVTVEKKRYP